MADGACFDATNWSLGGIRLDNLPKPLPEVGTILPLELELPFQGFEISFPVEAEIVRTVAAEGTIGAKFTELSERAHDLMSHFIEDLIRGKMATIDDTICRIDVPVTPISTQPDANPLSAMPKRRWPLKTVLMSAMYVALGISVFSYLLLLIYSNVARMEVESAVVSAPLLHMTMPVDGQLIPVVMEENAWVKRGQKLARIIDPKIRSKISDLRFQVEKERRDLFRAQERLRIEKSRMELYQVVNRTGLQSARAKVQAAREALAAIDVRYERTADLRKKGLVKKSSMDLVSRERAEAETKLKSAEFDLEQLAAMESVSSRRHFNQIEFVADLDLLALEVEKANSKLSLTNMRLERLESEQAGLSISAPFDGRIVSVNASGKAIVLRGRKIITLEKRTDPEITAFLNQDEIVHVGMNDPAQVYLPALGRSYFAIVRNIDRNSSSLRANANHYTWSGEKRKSASVALALEVPEGDRELVRGGLPAVVVFSRRSSSGLLAGLSSIIAPSGS